MQSINLFRNHPNFEDYAAGDVIFSEGDPGETMFAIRAGEVEIHIGDDVLETLGEGAIFGELALIDKVNRSASARARTACEIVVIDERQFTFLVQQTPTFALQVMRVLAERLRRNTPAK